MIVGPQDTQQKAIEKPETNTTEVKETVNTVKNTTENKTEVKLIDGLFEDEYLKNSTYQVILQHDGVKDVAIKKDGNTVSIAIVVDYWVSEDYAKELAEDAVRAVMTFSIDNPPEGKHIGKSKFDYVVGIYTPDGKQILMGAKSANAYDLVF